MFVFPNFKSTFLVFLTLFNGTQNCYKMTDISKEIANFFENKGLTQKDVARLLGTIINENNMKLLDRIFGMLDEQLGHRYEF